jgi:MarR family transcriptional regulator for hemolysin
MAIAMPAMEKNQLGQILMLVLKDFQQRLDADLAQRGFPGIRHRHRAVFVHLNRHGASRSVDLAEAAGIRPQSMMKIVHELEQLQLVQRRPDPQDSRAKLIEFTAAGEALIQQLSRSTEQVWQEYAAVLGEAKLSDTVASLNALIAQQEDDK